MSPEEMQSTIVAIDMWSIVFAIALFVMIVVGADQFIRAAKNIKDKIIDRRSKDLIKKTKAGDASVREELHRMHNEAIKDHDEFKEQLDNHSKAIIKV